MRGAGFPGHGEREHVSRRRAGALLDRGREMGGAEPRLLRRGLRRVSPDSGMRSGRLTVRWSIFFRRRRCAAVRRMPLPVRGAGRSGMAQSNDGARARAPRRGDAIPCRPSDDAAHNKTSIAKRRLAWCGLKHRLRCVRVYVRCGVCNGSMVHTAGCMVQYVPCTMRVHAQGDGAVLHHGYTQAHARRRAASYASRVRRYSGARLPHVRHACRDGRASRTVHPYLGRQDTRVG